MPAAADRRTAEEAPVSLELRVHSMAHAAEDVLLFDLRPPDGAPLPPFTAGAHVNVRMASNLQRSYSLLNDSDERHRYVVAVQRAPSGRGGSRWMHESLSVGDTLSIQGPRNHFPLDEAAPCSVLIAGGIGITPIWSMVQRLRALGRPWTLHYSARSRPAAALLADIERVASEGRVELNFDSSSGRHLDIPAIVAAAPAGAHFYCCGPAPMLKAFEAACGAMEPARVHLEHFAAEAPPAVERGFTVKLARRGCELEVARGQSILDALRAAGIDAPASCEQGICGVCETAVLEGVPDHRDLVLSDAEKASNGSLMICCSGARTPSLTLDL